MSLLERLAYTAALAAAAYALVCALQSLHRRAHQPGQQALWQQTARDAADTDPHWGVDTQLLHTCRRIAAAGTANRKNTERGSTS